MANAYVTYDRRSGQIVGVHHGAEHEGHARNTAQHHLKKTPHEHLDVLRIEPGSLEMGKHYRVDVARKVLVSSSPEEAGGRFGFGKTGSMSPSGSASPSKKG